MAYLHLSNLGPSFQSTGSHYLPPCLPVSRLPTLNTSLASLATLSQLRRHREILSYPLKLPKLPPTQHRQSQGLNLSDTGSLLCRLAFPVALLSPIAQASGFGILVQTRGSSIVLDRRRLAHSVLIKADLFFCVRHPLTLLPQNLLIIWGRLTEPAYKDLNGYGSSPDIRPDTRGKTDNRVTDIRDADMSRVADMASGISGYPQ
ncbi:hypothetical protein SISNIDRAFT_464697 [Sistotremastrum niveocremeum HHB9708]|uniref:Uncharacterized protein n=1 Tax=Sistotremastrum niveocremeum HHB9708 TaxID=1314777 RepID=A0A164WGF0_9AGAM|nr:hypothetical protein SISNIDRAFT_464697 [Sistotremastrum niveocremeum HHB9708]